MGTMGLFQLTIHDEHTSLKYPNPNLQGVSAKIITYSVYFLRFQFVP